MKYFLVGMGWLAVLAAGVEADAVGTLKGTHYVNMGSSFAAGSGIDPVRAGSVPRCKQSDANYAVLLAERLELVLDDQSCAGARSIHLLEPAALRKRDLP